MGEQAFARTQLHMNGSRAWNASLPRAKEPADPVLGLPPCAAISFPTLNWMSALLSLLRGCEHMPPGQPHCCIRPYQGGEVAFPFRWERGGRCLAVASTRDPVAVEEWRPPLCNLALFAMWGKHCSIHGSPAGIFLGNSNTKISLAVFRVLPWDWLIGAWCSVPCNLC